MNEWPENLSGLDVDSSQLHLLTAWLKAVLVVLLVLASLGLAQAAGLDEVLLSEMPTNPGLWADWFRDGAIGGFDGAGAMVGGY